MALAVYIDQISQVLPNVPIPHLPFIPTYFSLP